MLKLYVIIKQSPLFAFVLREIIPYLSQEDKAMLKAIKNVFIIPFLLTALTSNILVGFSWIILLSVIYTKIKTQKKLNASYFFKTLLFSAFILLFYMILVIF
jgi:hypothetical protein